MIENNILPCHAGDRNENIQRFLLHESGVLIWCKECGAVRDTDDVNWILPSSLRLYKIALGTYGNLINKNTDGIYFNQTELDSLITQFKRAGVMDYSVIELTPEQVKDEILTLNQKGEVCQK